MIKKVKMEDVRPGMYVHDLNVPWLEHKFLFNRFLLQNEKHIEKLKRENLLEILIDTEKGLDAVNAPTEEEAEAALMEKMIGSVSGRGSEPAAAKQKDRWAESKQVQAEAIKMVASIFNDVRAGKQNKAMFAVSAVTSIADAVLGDDGALVSLCRIKNRDDYTFQHCVSVSALLMTLCNSIGGYSSDDLIQIGFGGLFHDVGKMKTSNSILNKPGRLTEKEFETIMAHVNDGLDYLRGERCLSEPVLRIVAEHHERYDGSGYPRGLSKGQISKVGQMAAIIDVYDAITSRRAYRSALEPTVALKRIYEWGGRHFDAGLVHSFVNAMGIYPVGSLIRLHSGRLAVVIRQGGENLLQPLVRIVYNAAKGHRVPSQDVDLASPGCQDHIVGDETPENWGIDVMKYIAKGP